MREEELLSCYKRVARKIIVQAVKDYRYEVANGIYARRKNAKSSLEAPGLRLWQP